MDLPRRAPLHGARQREQRRPIGQMAEALRLRADQLVQGQNNLPVRLTTICASLGIRILRRASLNRGQAYLSWNRFAQEKPTVLLPLTNLSSWDRFSTAHELGHYILMTEFNWAPSKGSAYWETETICDAFARELLIPSDLIIDRGSDVACASASQALIACQALAREAIVPWIQAAKKLTEKSSRLIFFRLERYPDDRIKIISSSLLRERGRSMIIPKRSDFYKSALAAFSEAKATYRPVRRPLGRDEFLGTRLGELFSELAVSQIFVEFIPWSENIRLSAVR